VQLAECLALCRESRCAKNSQLCILTDAVYLDRMSCGNDILLG
jgi:hypothetical protein